MAESAPPAGGRTPAVLLISPGVVKPTDRDFGLPHLVSLGGYVRHHLGVRVEILDLGYEGETTRPCVARSTSSDR